MPSLDHGSQGGVGSPRTLIITPTGLHFEAQGRRRLTLGTGSDQPCVADSSCAVKGTPMILPWKTMFAPTKPWQSNIV